MDASLQQGKKASNGSAEKAKAFTGEAALSKEEKFKSVGHVRDEGDVTHNDHNCCPSQGFFFFMAIATADAPTPNLLAISAIEIPASSPTTMRNSLAP